MSEKEAPLVFVDWEDSAQPVGSWLHISDIEDAKAVSCISVGWCIYADDRVLVLAPNVGEVGKEAEQVSGVIRIPKSCITKITELDHGEGPPPSQARTSQGPSGPWKKPRNRQAT